MIKVHLQFFPVMPLVGAAAAMRSGTKIRNKSVPNPEQKPRHTRKGRGTSLIAMQTAKYARRMK